MSKLVIVGTVAFDAIETPFGKTDKILGGAATFIGLAASQFNVDSSIVSIVGGDFSQVYLDLLENKNIDIYCATLSASRNYTKVNFTKASAIIVGTESTGLSNEWLEAATQNIIIPMEGEIDSMNVSVSAAILIFEAKRQRSI